MEYQKFHLGRAVELAMGARVGVGGVDHVPAKNRARTLSELHQCLSSINERQALSGKVSPGVSRPERLGRERGEERAVLGAGSSTNGSGIKKKKKKTCSNHTFVVAYAWRPKKIIIKKVR